MDEEIVKKDILKQLNFKLKQDGYIFDNNIAKSFNGIINENKYDLYLTKKGEYFDIGIDLSGCNNITIPTRLNKLEKSKTPRGVFYPISKKLNGNAHPTNAIAKFNDQYICAGFEIHKNGNTQYENVDNIMKVIDTAYKHIQKFSIKQRKSPRNQSRLELELE